MTSKLMITAAALTLLAGTSAFAQQREPERGGAAVEHATPNGANNGAQHNAPAAKPAAPEQRNNRAQGNQPNATPQAQNGGRTETNGQATPGRNENNAGNREQNDHAQGTPNTKPNAQAQERNEGNQNNPAGERRNQNRANDDHDQNRQGQNRAEERNNPNDDRDQNRAEDHNNDRRDRETVGQGAAGGRGSVTFTQEQRTRIHDVIIKERSAPRVDRVDFALTVGTAVPRSVRIVTVPREIVEVQPTWRGYEYFMVGEQIVVVNPANMQIVAVFEA